MVIKRLRLDPPSVGTISIASISGLNGPWLWHDPPGFTMIRGRDVLWNLDAPTAAVNNRKREAADSAEILDDRPDRDDQREVESRIRRGGHGESGKR